MPDSSEEQRSSGEHWPVSVDLYRNLLLGAMSEKVHGVNPGPIRSNVAYALQYLEYLDNSITKKHHVVVFTHLVKTFVITSCSIVEAILYYAIVTSGEAPKLEWSPLTNWEKKDIKGLNKNIKIVTNVFIKEEDPKIDLSKMTLNSMSRHAEKRKLFSAKIYRDLSYARKLRNRVHLQAASEYSGTDFNEFNLSELNIMKKILYDLLTSEYFPEHPSRKEILAFLNVNVSPADKAKIDAIEEPES